ncbi:hypothetical protein AFFFEF_04925 [Methylorubrum extorquens]
MGMRLPDWLLAAGVNRLAVPQAENATGERLAYR